MTTPFQPAPDGAYVVDDGGGDYNYGQGLSDQSAAHLMIGGFATIAGIPNPLSAVAAAFAQFADLLSTLPLELLQLFEPMIPDVIEGAFSTVAGAVEAILGFFQTLGPVLNRTFMDFLENAYNIVETSVKQIFDIVNGLVVTPITAGVAAFLDWFNGNNLGSIGGIVSSLQGTVQNVIDAIISAIRRIPFVGGTIANILEDLTGLANTADAAVSPNNPAVVDLAGRVAVLENTAGGNTWSDQFDRSSLGADWTLLQGVLQFLQTGGTYDYIKSNSTVTVDLRYDALQFLTAKHFAQMRIREQESGSDALVIMADSTLSHGCGVRIIDPAFTSGGNKLQIVTAVGPDDDDLTMRAEVDLPDQPVDADVIGIGFSPVTNTYIAYYNDAAMCSWTDSTGIVPTTGRHLHVLLNIGGGFGGNRGAGIDNVVAYDWA